MPQPYTPRQGQYLAFIFYYTKLHGHAPAEADMQRYFNVAPIRLGDYVELHLRANPDEKRAEVIARREDVFDACQKDIRCQCVTGGVSRSPWYPVHPG